MEAKQTITVAIVDDHTLFREGIKKILQLEKDIEVVGEATDGEEVIGLLTRSCPDVLLLDVKMEKINGLQVLPRIVEQYPALKVIVLTAQISQAESVQAIKEGARGIILKHAASEFLIRGIRKVYQGELWADSTTMTRVVETLSMKFRGDRQSERSRKELSQRELEVVRLVAAGHRNKEIADKLFISEQTVKTHLSNIFQKLEVSDRLELALFAMRSGLAEL
ncbi:MAG: response regulator transcription factor [Acidobacteriota bacterium]